MASSSHQNKTHTKVSENLGARDVHGPIEMSSVQRLKPARRNASLLKKRLLDNLPEAKSPSAHAAECDVASGPCGLPLRHPGKRYDQPSAPPLKQAMAALKIVYKDPRKLKPRTNNPRTHTRRQIKQIAACVRELGFINPVLTDARNRIIAGHARVEAATLLNMCEIPTVCVGHLRSSRDPCLRHCRQQAGRKCRVGSSFLGARVPRAICRSRF